MSRLNCLFDPIERGNAVLSGRKTVNVVQHDRSETAGKIVTYLLSLTEKIDSISLRWVNPQQTEDINLEINRFAKMVDFCILIGKASATYKYSVNANTVRQNIEDLLFTFARFTPDKSQSVDCLSETLKRELRTNQTLACDEEKLILPSLKDIRGLSQGKERWFKCPKGHFYGHIVENDFVDTCVEREECAECKKLRMTV